LEQRLRVYEGFSSSGQTSHVPVANPPRHFKQLNQTAGQDARVEDDMSELLQGVNHMTVDRRKPEFYGGSSLNAIIDAVESDSEREDLATAQTSESPAPSTNYRTAESVQSYASRMSLASLPAQPASDEFVYRYFQTAHLMYPVLDQDSFLQRYHNFWRGSIDNKGHDAWLAILFMVIAHGHQCSTVHADIVVRNQALSYPHGETCFQSARMLFADVPFTGGDVCGAQAMFLAVGAAEAGICMRLISI
jgi:hypothetical protein